jgi:hypothetical protein
VAELERLVDSKRLDSGLAGGDGDAESLSEVLSAAVGYAAGRGDRHLGTEHIALALVTQASQALTSLGLTQSSLGVLRQTVEREVAARTAPDARP